MRVHSSLYTILILVILALGCNRPSGENPDNRSRVSSRWSGKDIFETWEYEHQDTSTVCSVWLDDDILSVRTRGGTFDRTKMHTPAVYTSGTYVWKTYIPEMTPGDMTSVGSWIYCDDHHEIDFEVGWGSSEVRKETGCPDDMLLACMTNQDFPYSSSYVPIAAGWHEFSIELKVVDGCYDVRWLIDGTETKRLQTGFGTETAFRIYVSVENLKFIGDHVAASDNVGRYEWVRFKGFMNK